MARSEKKALSKIKRSLYPITPKDISVACKAASNTETLDKRQYKIVKKGLSIFKQMDLYKSKIAYRNFNNIYGEYKPNKSLYNPRSHKDTGKFNDSRVLYMKTCTRELLDILIDI